MKLCVNIYDVVRNRQKKKKRPELRCITTRALSNDVFKSDWIRLRGQSELSTLGSSFEI